MTFIRYFIVLGALLLPIGCGDRTDGADRTDATADGARTKPAAGTAADTLPPRPDTLRGTISLEGMDEPFTFRLYRSPPTAPVPFTTYVPSDMAVEPARSGDVEAFRFIAEFGGMRNDDAFLAVAFLPAGIDEEEAIERARTFAERNGIRLRRPDAPRRFAWSLAEWDFSRALPDGGAALGTVALGRHGDRYFYVALHYPEEYEEGLAPRADRILREWRWEDTGEMLGAAGTDSHGR